MNTLLLTAVIFTYIILIYIVRTKQNKIIELEYNYENLTEENKRIELERMRIEKYGY